MSVASNNTLIDRSSISNLWLTPKSFLTCVEKYFGGPIPLDPATEDNNPTNANILE